MKISDYISNDGFECVDGQKDPSPNRFGRNEFLVGLYHSDCVDLPRVISILKDIHIDDVPIEFFVPAGGCLDIDPPGASLNVTVYPDDGHLVDSVAVADSDGNVLFSDTLRREYDLPSIDTMQIECEWEIE